MSSELGRVEIVALTGLPEVRVGDDLAGMIGDALAATDGALPIAAGDVLVVTQKVVSKAEGAVDLGAGWTPLMRADRLAAELGLGELWLKNDTMNPTGSFKDRVTSVALTKARELGFKVAACASTGNLANSVAAHAARAGLDSVVLIPHDLEAAKVTMTAVYGGTVVAVEGTYDDVNRLCAELTSERPGWAFVNVNVRTYYAEGSKTLAFEIAEQLGWQAPDHVVVPVGSGSQLTKVAKGFAELHQVGLLDEALAVLGSRLVVGVDCESGICATHGWQERSEMSALHFVHLLQEHGARRIVYTDVLRDGMLEGPNLEGLRELTETTDLEVVMSGGISRLEDLRWVKRDAPDVVAVIVGRALYEGSFTLAQARAILD